MHPSYLIHYNKYHDPKTGQFTFAKDAPYKIEYDGKSKKSYVDDMAAKYREREGYGRGKSIRVARSAAEQNKMNTTAYNRNLKANKKYTEEANAALASGDQKKYEKYTNKAKKAYKDAKVDEILLSLDNQYNLGKAFYKQKVDQALLGIGGNLASMYAPGGYMEYYNAAKAEVEKLMKEEM